MSAPLPETLDTELPYISWRETIQVNDRVRFEATGLNRYRGEGTLIGMWPILTSTYGPAMVYQVKYDNGTSILLGDAEILGVVKPILFPHPAEK